MEITRATSRVHSDQRRHAPRQRCSSVRGGRGKDFLRKMDHQSIYLLIAGSYTPFCLVTLRGPWGWSLLGVVWGLAIVGSLQDLRPRNDARILSVVIYLLMGWAAVVALVPMVNALGRAGFAWVAAGGVLYVIASGQAGFDVSAGFASNGYGELSPGGYSMLAALVTEVVLTAGFLVVILGSTSSKVPGGFAPIAIGLALTLIHLISIPVTNTSVNPARSTGPALIVGGWAIQQLWMFWVAPLLGAVVGGVLYRWLGKEQL